MTNKAKFKKRIYHNLREIYADAAAILSKRKQIKSLMRDGELSKSFRERIMLAVTEVNGCRYCQYAHAKMALDAGLPDKEVKALADGVFQHSPPEEVPALLYAQHWAEENGNPQETTRQQVLEIYGKSRVNEMELAMRMIRMGNLLGNTWDYILFWLSGGRWGNKR